MARRSMSLTIRLAALASLLLALILLAAAAVSAWLHGLCWACGG
jgi:hypothetical protein